VKRFIIGILIVLFVLFALTVMIAEGETVIVAKDGHGDYNSIQDAIDNASAGDTIRVHSGTYHENVVVNKSVGLIGNGSANTTIDGEGDSISVYITENGCKVSGLRIINSDYAGIWVESNHTIISQNNCSSKYAGILIANSKNCRISNNTCTNNYDGIWIGSSSDCLISNNTCEYNNYGINLVNASNCSIDSNVCPGNDISGIDVATSTNCTVTNNKCENNYCGIYLGSNENCTIQNNICSLNEKYGIQLVWSNGCNASNNICDNNLEYGLYLERSTGCTLDNNTMNDDSIFITGTFQHWNTQRITSTNTVNGKPVYYYKNDEDFTVPYGAGQVILANCSRIEVGDQYLSNGSVGILIGFSSNITIANSTFSSNIMHGIFFHFSSYCTIMDNTFSGNTHSGINGGSFCFIMNNTFQNNNFGIYGSSGIVSNNTFDNNTYGIYKASKAIFNNSCSNNTYGIYLGGSQSTIANNICESNEFGIYIDGSYPSRAYNTIESNTCLNNDIGISVNNYASYCTIANNTCAGNDDFGIFLELSDYCTITNNICSDNSNGIRLDYSDSCTITNNTCMDNANGILLYQSRTCILTNNTCSGNNNHGIYAYTGSSQTIIESNTCESNKYGIGFRQSNDCTIANNTCSSNDISGMQFSLCWYNFVMNNTIERDEYGIRILGSNRNEFINNSIIQNRLMGFYIADGSQDNEIHWNIIQGNLEFGMNATDNDDISVNATDNFWGYVSGPYHPENNSGGKGDNVTDLVLFDPWDTNISGGPRTLHVDDDGSPDGNGSAENPFQTIYDALNESRDGDTIYIREGSYTEDLIIGKSVRIVGQSESLTQISRGPEGAIEIQAENVTLSEVMLSDFMIRVRSSNVLIHNITTLQSRIIIVNVTNVSIHDSYLRYGNDGIFIHSSSGIHLRNNTILNVEDKGIEIIESTDCHLERNEIYSASIYGVRLYHSSRVLVANSTIHDAGILNVDVEFSDNCTLLGNLLRSSESRGLRLWKSENITVLKTTLDKCGVQIVEGWESITLDESNTVNGKPIHFRTHESGTVVPEGRGQVILYRCTDIVVSNQNISHVRIGIYAFECDNILITNNSCHYSGASGIRVDGTDEGGSANISIIGNTCNWSWFGSGIYVGISLTNGTAANIRIENNSCNANDEFGIQLRLEQEGGDRSMGSSNGLVSTRGKNPSSGMEISSGKASIGIRNNTLLSNDQSGIYILLKGDPCPNGHISISDNTCISSGWDGIRVTSVDVRPRNSIITIERNTVERPNTSGILLQRQQNVTVQENLLIGGSLFGINLQRCSNTTVSHNVIEVFSDGIGLSNAETIHMMHNTILQTDRGLSLDASSNITIENNTITENGIGILAKLEMHNTQVRWNRIFNNTEFGLDATDLVDSSIDARHNLWGDPSGPYHPDLNPGGLGDNITENVGFMPWWDRNLRPIAEIISPDQAIISQSTEVTFVGIGHDENEIIGFNWTSSLHGKIGDQSSFSLRNLTNGTHIISFSVMDDKGAWSDPVSISIQINGIPISAIIDITPTSVYQNEEVTISGSGSDDGSITGYLWSSSKDGVLSHESEFSVSNLSEGQHVISFRVKDNHGLWSENTIAPLTIFVPPVAIIENISPGQATHGSKIFFIASATSDFPILEYLWASSIDGTLYDGPDLNFNTQDLSVANHTITLSVRDANGVWSDDVTATVEIEASKARDSSGSSLLPMIVIACVIILLIGAFRMYHVESLPTIIPDQESEVWEESDPEEPSGDRGAEDPVNPGETDPEAELCSTCDTPLTFFPPMKKYYCPSCKDFTEPGGVE